MEKTNKEVRELVIDFKANHLLDINPLSMKIHGIVDAAVNGISLKFSLNFLI